MFVQSGHMSIMTSSFTNCRTSGQVSHDQNKNLRCIAPWMCVWTVWALRGRSRGPKLALAFGVSGVRMLDRTAGDECCWWQSGRRGCSIHTMCTSMPMGIDECGVCVRLEEAQCMESLAM